VPLRKWFRLVPARERARLRLVCFPDRYDARAAPSAVAPAVSAPLVAYYGSADEDLDERSVAAWGALTSAYFTLRAMPGGHFYLSDNTAGLVHDVMARVSPAGLRDPVAIS
jgi:surfactin synthase thioesterase subunit